MIVYPAIDLYGGKVVRLFKGDFSRKTEYGEKPSEAARKLAAAGAEWLHIVDLEGAEAGHPLHLAELREMASLGLPIQFGGGLRTELAIASSLEAGATRAMVGSLLTRSEDMPDLLFRRFGPALLPAVDVKNGRVAISGWKETVALDPVSFIARLRQSGFEQFLVTAINRDGTGTGPDLDLYTELCHIEGTRIIAAGGVSSLSDIRALRRRGLDGAVMGKAIYNGTVTPETLFREVNNHAD